MIPAHADVVIVGGGSCGCVLAAGLSDDPDRTVLLLEEGTAFGSASAVPREIRDAAVLPVGPESPWTADFPGRLTSDVQATVTRGRVLGGSGAVNGAYFVRARPDDFASWPASWSYEEVLPSFRAVETDTDIPGDLHGSSGPIPVARVPRERMHPLSRAFVNASESAGFAPVADLNAPGPDGVGAVPSNMRDGTRVGPFLAYLAPVLDRPNLTVAGGVSATRVVMTGGRAVGVEIAGPDGPRTISAGHVIVAAGAVRSPQLLMLSGIGPADELRRLGVDPLHDLPAVGRDFSDHPEFAVPYRFRPGLPSHTLLLETVLHTENLELRPYAAAFGAAIPGSGVADPVLGVVLTRPRSRGRIVLDERDPRRPPLLDYRYLTDPADRQALEEGVRLAADLLAATTGVVEAGSVDARGGRLGTSLHLSGTCRMGDDEHAVVDEWCRVRGIEGLSVVDTSVFPQVPSRGPHATAVMLAHRIAATARDALPHTV
ncbi:mycofactocin system GMC family oxidoreductase MftG [Rhodococcus pyridinivorans]|uniref:mycofactocin dehydrogenase MftG n=1 Tax=Rhodococcus pyridinivorans TaxID=103816 RepID=UPI001E5E4149|nr:mycofactocin system GMC family oxidoreductase MftG [Rhodococcus pyridinivorans]MCD5421032.1 mycofactocin system GMC family oxidoreductase MftG [Rhodococcus pyridinivorans]